MNISPWVRLQTLGLTLKEYPPSISCDTSIGLGRETAQIPVIWPSFPRIRGRHLSELTHYTTGLAGLDLGVKGDG
jgi:hypothetical protein